VVLTADRREAAHLRILTPPQWHRDLHRLGLNDEQSARIRESIGGLQGLVLIAGPSGSGKTTTAYSMFAMLDCDRLVAASIEDPAEFDLPNVRQVEVDERRGLTMEEGLRSILRMDPDIVLVGEVRDRASAEIAGRAALAGRLVLATIHARDAMSAIQAMHYLSVPYYVLGSGLRLVVAQNLVRRVCPRCARLEVPGGFDLNRKLLRRMESKSRSRCRIREAVITVAATGISAEPESLRLRPCAKKRLALSPAALDERRYCEPCGKRVPSPSLSTR